MIFEKIIYLKDGKMNMYITTFFTSFFISPERCIISIEKLFDELVGMLNKNKKLYAKVDGDIKDLRRMIVKFNKTKLDYDSYGETYSKLEYTLAPLRQLSSGDEKARYTQIIGEMRELVVILESKSKKAAKK